ncbi:DUF4166 domain-containing protein [Lysobacter tyrosinilyticus]
MNAPQQRLLFPALLGAAFETLPPRVRALHLHAGPQRWLGEVSVERGRGWLSRLCAWATHLPPAGSGPIAVDIDASPTAERWIRHVAGHAMPSHLWARDDLLCERLGLVTFGFRLQVADEAIVWNVAHVRVFGIALPARWFREVGAREFQQADRYCFDVVAALPIAGLLVRYRGWLDVC